ncbi:MAG TPA: acylphosphatase [Chromatiales bacterium]|nr:acylphosphatase [Chromatiales bacterium]
MSIARRIVVRGRVQGVYFREGMRAEADRLGVSGWMRNLADGSVEAFLQGKPQAVEGLLEWAHRGPPMARVDGVQVKESHPDPGIEGFNRLPST